MLFFNSVVDVIVMRARAEDRTQRHPLGAPQYAPLFGAALGFTVVSQVKSSQLCPLTATHGILWCVRVIALLAQVRATLWPTRTFTNGT